jgi:hypothetical protein
MKTIELKDEYYFFLMELSDKLNTQNNYGINDPIIFQVFDEIEVPAFEGCGEIKKYVKYDNSFLVDDNESIKEALLEIWNENKKYKSFDMWHNSLDEFDIETILEKNGYCILEFNKMGILSNSFLTRESCENNIRLNEHRYNDPTVYCTNLSANNEMDQLIKILKSLTNGNK